VEKCKEYEEEGRPLPDNEVDQRGEVVEKDCQVCRLINEDGVDRSRWRKLIKDV